MTIIDPSAILAGWREAEQAAIEGPWAWEATGDKDSSWAVGLVQDEEGNTLSGQMEAGQGIIIEGVCESIDGHIPDAAFIVTARTAMPRLLKAVEDVLAQHRRSDEPLRTHRICRMHAHLHNPSPEWRESVVSCPDCTVTEKWVCAERSCRHECPDDDEWPCPTRRAITSALVAPADPAGKE